jgi:SAM-dependent methyltransferase
VVDEPLRLSAPIARRLALEHCTGGCAWLHSFWQCLRILQLAADPTRHASFYAAAFGSVGVSSARVLVSGAADYSMLAHVLAAFRARGIGPRVTVLDTCETPLALNRWYAERGACSIETVRANLLEYQPPAPFDLICTHSFFGQFSRAERPRFAAAWRRLLRPGGRAVTVGPLRPFGADERNRFTEEQAAALRFSVEARAEELAELLGIPATTLLDHAEQYLNARYGYPVRDVDELRALFEGAGFTLEHLAPVAVAGADTGAGGPGLRKAGLRYAEVIARAA